MKFFIKVASLLILVSSFSVLSDENSLFKEPFACKQEKKTVVVYSNGMFNDENDIFRSKVRLEIFIDYLIHKKLLNIDDGEVIEYDTANNIDKNRASNIANVITQKFNFTLFEVKQYFNNVFKIPFKKDDSDWESFTSEMAYLEMLINNDIIDEMVEKYEYYLKNNYRIIIVSHSQGNMYATAAYAKIMSKEGMDIYKKSISIVSVGSPIDTVARGSIPNLDKPHATAFEDLYMWGVRLITVGSNNSTFSYVDSTEDYMGHSFVNAYMFDKNSKDHIANGLIWSFDNTDYPKNEISNVDLIKISSIGLPNQYTKFYMEEYYPENGFSPDYYVIDGRTSPATIKGNVGPRGSISISGKTYSLPCGKLPKRDFKIQYNIQTVNTENSGEFTFSIFLMIGDETKEYRQTFKHNGWSIDAIEISVDFIYNEEGDYYTIDI